MRKVIAGWTSLLALFSTFGPTLAAESRARADREVKPFTLVDPRSGKSWSLQDQATTARLTVVVFLGAECPVNNLYLGTLAELHKSYASKGVSFAGINSNEQDDEKAVAHHAQRYDIPFPVLKDSEGSVAASFGAERTPESFVLGPDRVIRYRGRIDDQYGRGVKRRAPIHRELAGAIDALLAGRPVPVKETEVVGCLIGRTAPAKSIHTAAPVGYHQHVARILQAHCQECHRPGEIGPFALTGYQAAKAWARAIREEVSQKRMPPWHAAEPRGTFLNDRRMSAADETTLLAWIDQGCPEGARKDAPTRREFVAGWNIPKPDLIVAMNREFPVPADGGKTGIPYQYFLAGEAFTEEKWVTAAQVRPGSRSVVHHIIVYVLSAETKLPEKITGLSDLGGGFAGPPQLVSFVPGDETVQYPNGFGARVPKGSRLVFEVHYTSNGKPAADRSKVGLVFAESVPKHEVLGDAALNFWFRIPSKSADHKVSATAEIDRDIILLSMNPHMHLRGKSFRYLVKTPDGKTETLLSIPRYDFNWQTTHVLAKPRSIPKGSKIVCEAAFDNSAANPNNPDPSVAVRWGDQSWEEMMIGFFTYYEPKR